MKKNDISDLYTELKNTSFPSFSSNEELSNWIEDLIYIDSVIAGLASSAKDKNKILKDHIPALDKIEKKLALIKIESDNDAKILKECVQYLNILKEIRNVLLKHTF